MTKDTFFAFVRFFAALTKPVERNVWVLLLVDNHSSRYSEEMWQFAAEHHIILMALPSNSTASMQPVDVGPNKQFKAELFSRFDAECCDPTKPPVVKHTVVQRILHPAWDAAFSRAHIDLGWRESGFWPLNPGKITAVELVPQTLADAQALLPVQTLAIPADLAEICVLPTEEQLARVHAGLKGKGGRVKPRARILTTHGERLVADEVMRKVEEKKAAKEAKEAKRRERTEKKEKADREQAEKKQRLEAKRAEKAEQKKLRAEAKEKKAAAKQRERERKDQDKRRARRRKRWGPIRDEDDDVPMDPDSVAAEVRARVELAGDEKSDAESKVDAADVPLAAPVVPLAAAPAAKPADEKAPASVKRRGRPPKRKRSPSPAAERKDLADGREPRRRGAARAAKRSCSAAATSPALLPESDDFDGFELEHLAAGKLCCCAV